jgi:hypothetical protein
VIRRLNSLRGFANENKQTVFSITHSGSIDAYGKGSIGIFSQSVGGGGGAQGEVNLSDTNAASWVVFG